MRRSQSRGIQVYLLWGLILYIYIYIYMHNVPASGYLDSKGMQLAALKLTAISQGSQNLQLSSWPLSHLLKRFLLLFLRLLLQLFGISCVPSSRWTSGLRGCRRAYERGALIPDKRSCSRDWARARLKTLVVSKS